MGTNNTNTIVKVGGMDCKVILDSVTLQNEINKIADLICKDYPGPEPPVLIIVTNGAMYFGVSLSMALQKKNFSHIIDTVRIKRYSGDGETNKITIISKPQIDLFDKDIIVIEDVIDEGVTLNFLNEYLKEIRKPRAIEYCVLIEKSGHVPLNFEVKYKILDNFRTGWLIGFGMDSEQLFRGLDFICIKL